MTYTTNLTIPSNRIQETIRIEQDIVYRAKKFAVKYHGDQKYGGEFPYAIHLQAVERVLLRFNIFDVDLRAAAWLHDTLEDTTARYEDIETLFNVRVAGIVGAVTEPKGGNRARRHEQTYPKIRLSPDAVIVKLADRIANVESGGSLNDMYRKEYPSFKRALYRDDDIPHILAMWSYLDTLLV